MVGKVEGLDELMKQIGRLGQFPKDMAKELRAANRKIGAMARDKVRPQIPVSRKPFKIYDPPPRGNVRMVIPPGTLRRSIAVKNAKGSKINVFVGPRRGGRTNLDGWFAGIVESGHVGGRNRSTNSPNYNKIGPALARLRPAMERLMIMKYRKVFDKFKP